MSFYCSSYDLKHLVLFYEVIPDSFTQVKEGELHPCPKWRIDPESAQVPLMDIWASCSEFVRELTGKKACSSGRQAPHLIPAHTHMKCAPSVLLLTPQEIVKHLGWAVHMSLQTLQCLKEHFRVLSPVTKSPLLSEDSMSILQVRIHNAVEFQANGGVYTTVCRGDKLPWRIQMSFEWLKIWLNLP